MNKADKAALARLEVVRDEARRTFHELNRLRSRRDLLILAAYRRDISYRQIARAAGVHYTRVSQLVADATEVIDDAGLEPLRSKAKKPKGV